MGTTNFDAVAAPDGFTGPIDGAVGGTTPALGTFTYAAQSVADALTAAGTTRANALQLAAAINVLATVASGTGVILPDAAIGAVVTVYNNGANPVQVYATGSQTVDAVAGATGVPLANAKRSLFTRTTATKWLSAQLGVVSA